MDPEQAAMIKDCGDRVPAIEWVIRNLRRAFYPGSSTERTEERLRKVNFNFENAIPDVLTVLEPLVPTLNALAAEIPDTDSRPEYAPEESDSEDRPNPSSSPEQHEAARKQAGRGPFYSTTPETDQHPTPSESRARVTEFRLQNVQQHRPISLPTSEGQSDRHKSHPHRQRQQHRPISRPASEGQTSQTLGQRKSHPNRKRQQADHERAVEQREVRNQASYMGERSKGRKRKAECEDTLGENSDDIPEASEEGVFKRRRQ